MSKQVLIIEPQNELKFKVEFSGIFQQGYTTYMKLTNPTNDLVLYKIKTTAPKKYCVRPNSGALDPHATIDIAITPQPVYVDPNEKNKHKFMVQSVIAPEGKTNIEQVWKEISPGQLMDSKLKCVFEQAPGGTGNYNDTTESLNEANKKKVGVSGDAKPIAAKADSTDNTTQNEVTKKRFDLEDAMTTISTTKKSDADAYKYEFERLREEENKLKHENLRLKEEILHLRNSSAAALGKSSGVRHSYDPPEKMQVLSAPLLAIALGLGLLGIIIGKFFM